MKCVYALVMLCCMSLAGMAQIVAVSPTGAGGFDAGATMGANGWTLVNPATAANQWTMGATAVPFAGGNCAYVTNTGTGGPYAYNNAAARTCHFYRDVVIPAGSTTITLSFQWKGSGEAGADQMLVYTAPTSVIPVANAPASPATAMTGATLVWTQPTLTSTYTAATMSLPASLAGTTVRLIFTWQNNGSGGVTPGAAVDNISLTYICATPQPITGTGSICTGATTALADATTPGAWSSSTGAVGTISSTGVVTGIAAGTTTISYTVGTCLSPATLVVSVLAAPAPISGPATVCLGTTVTYTDIPAGGTWSSTMPGIAPINTTTGDVTGLALGTTTISYSAGCGAPVGRIITVVALPASITTTINHVCAGGGTMGVTDATAGGTWSASPATNAMATTTGPTTGLVTGMGITGGTATVTYTSSLGCLATTAITIDPLPSPIAGSVPICVGAATTVTDALPGGTWSSSVTGVATVGSSSGLVFGVLGGTTVISYTNACGSATTVFTVNAYPGAIVGDDTLCIDGTTALANPLIGGTWSSSNPGVAAVAASSGFVTALAAGTTRITYSMPGGCNAYRVVAVLNWPPPITGATMQVCPGSTITLAHPMSGGVWSTANPFVATVTGSAGIVTGVAADTVHIVYTTAAGCIVYANVTVNPLPAHIVGHLSLCTMKAETLYNPSPGGTWGAVTPAIATIDAATGVVLPLTVGTARFRYTLPTGCSIVDSFKVKPLPVPIVDFDAAHNKLYTSEEYITYQWYHTLLGMDTGETSSSITGADNGAYYVTVTDTNGCTGTSLPFGYNVTMGATAKSNGESAVRVYPVPASSVLYVTGTGKLRAVISGADGKKEMEQADAAKIDISGLPNGVHIITLYDGEGNRQAVRKLLKQ